MSYIDSFWKDEFPKLQTEATLPKVKSPYVQKLLKNKAFIRRLCEPVTVYSNDDVPYLAGYSKDGKEIFYDRHFNPFMHYHGRIVDTRQFITIHEVGEKALIDLFHLKYQAAHHIITHFEAQAVHDAGINWWTYTKFLSPQIKGVYHEQLQKIPKHLDTTPYKDEHERKILEELKKGHDIRPFHHKVTPDHYRRRH
jgi:hypothetical protein